MGGLGGGETAGSALHCAIVCYLHCPVMGVSAAAPVFFRLARLNTELRQRAWRHRRRSQGGGGHPADCRRCGMGKPIRLRKFSRNFHTMF